MRKRIIIPVVVVLFLIIGFGWFYYYKYLQEVTERYLVVYTLPHEEEGVFGTRMSEFKSKISVLNKYESDADAVSIESKKAALFHENLLKKLEKENFDDDKDYINKAKMDVYKDMLLEQRMLISVSHFRSLDAKEVLELIKKHGIFSKDLIEFAEKNKIKANIYPLTTYTEDLLN